ncbi:hypothetical protein IWQ57_004569, partial [Coemansia nantahalensis]
PNRDAAKAHGLVAPAQRQGGELDDRRLGGQQRRQQQWRQQQPRAVGRGDCRRCRGGSGGGPRAGRRAAVLAAPPAKVAVCAKARLRRVPRVQSVAARRHGRLPQRQRRHAAVAGRPPPVQPAALPGPHRPVAAPRARRGL